jgi:hypothetical protein
LAAGARRPVHVGSQVVGVDLDVDLLGLGKHRHGGRRRVHPPLALGDRHPLHAVGSCLEVHAGPDPVALDGERHLVEAPEVGRIAAQHVDGPSLAGGERAVHLVQVAGEEVGLLATLGPADLDDDVALVVGIPRQQQDPQLVGEPGDRRFGGVDLGAEDVTLVARRVRQHLLRHLEVGAARSQLAWALDDRGQLAVTLRHLLEVGLVRDQVGVTQARLGIAELLIQLCEAFEHDERG